MNVKDAAAGDEVEKRVGRLGNPQERWLVVAASGLKTPVVLMEVAVDMLQSGLDKFYIFFTFTRFVSNNSLHNSFFLGVYIRLTRVSYMIVDWWTFYLHNL